jgi:hypothetical protein
MGNYMYNGNKTTNDIILLQNLNDIKYLKTEIDNLKLIVSRQEKMIINLVEQKKDKNKEDYNNIYHFYNEGLEEALTEYFSIHKPKLVPRVNNIMEKYKGKEKTLLKDLKDKYGKELNWEPKIHFNNMIFI